MMTVVASALRVARWRRELVGRHLERCLPEAGESRRRGIASGLYDYIGELLAEAAYATSMTRENLAKRVQLENPEVVAGALEADGRVLILSSHHCNWEWLLLRCSTAFGVPLTAAYKPIRNVDRDRTLRGLRERFGGTMIPAKQIVQHLLEQRGQVRLLAMLADQSPPACNDQRSWFEFFGQQTAFFQGPGWIGSRFGYTVFLAAMRREARGHYSVRFIELAPRGTRCEPDQIVQAYVRELESHVRAHPEQYIWAYNRWKREKPLYD